jgi:hypothetical protein
MLKKLESGAGPTSRKLDIRARLVVHEAIHAVPILFHSVLVEKDLVLFYRGTIIVLT